MNNKNNEPFTRDKIINLIVKQLDKDFSNFRKQYIKSHKFLRVRNIINNILMIFSVIIIIYCMFSNNDINNIFLCYAILLISTQFNKVDIEQDIKNNYLQRSIINLSLNINDKISKINKNNK